MSYPERYSKAAERIITGAGLTFALAAGAGKEGDLREARAYLKDAICQALAEETALHIAPVHASAKRD